jgi:hypothetical protein
MLRSATGLWIIAHECGHQAFSESKTINNAVGWVLHSICGVPYHSWRISHGRHHAATGHIHRDEVFVPRTRDQLGLPKLDEVKEDVEGFNVTAERQKELAEAIGDAPLFVLVNLIVQQVRRAPLSSEPATARTVADSVRSTARRLADVPHPQRQRPAPLPPADQPLLAVGCHL